MKKPYKILVLFLFSAAALTNLHADEKIKIHLHQPPPNMLGVKDLWKLDITNTTRENINIYLTGTATESKKGLIVSGKSKVITVTPGTKRYDYNDFKNGGEVNWKDKSIQEVLLRIGNVPEGEYTICVTAFYESNEVADQETCIEQSIKQMGSITLISPGDGAELDPDTLPGLMFSWTPLPGAKDYTLKIVEIKGDEVPEVAIKMSKAFFAQNGITTTSFQYPVSEKKFEKRKKYTWQIISGDVKSEVNTFMITQGGSITFSLTQSQPGSCCFDVNINTTVSGYNAFKIVSPLNPIFLVNSPNCNITSGGTPVTYSKWSYANGFPVGSNNYGIICFQNSGSFPIYINWSMDGGTTYIGTDTINVSCPLSPIKDTCEYLCNSDFETYTGLFPLQTGGMVNAPSAWLPCWQTTASDGFMEIWSNGMTVVENPSFVFNSYSGGRFVELNANMLGTLYQTFSAVKDKCVKISFAHRGRYPNPDVMDVKIGPLGGPYTNLGSYSDNKTAWSYHTIPYTFPSTGTYEIRFESVSSNGGAGPDNGGNLLDAVSIICCDSIPPVVNDSCRCGSWVDNKITVINGTNENILLCGKTYDNIQPVSNVNITFPQYGCMPSSCNASYTWQITGPIAQSGTTNTISNADFSQPGYYTITMFAYCGGLKCDSCKTNIDIKEPKGNCPNFRASPFSIHCHNIFSTNNYDFKIAVTNNEPIPGNIFLASMTSGMTINSYNPTTAGPISSTIVTGNATGSGSTLCIKVSFSITKKESCDTVICFNLPSCGVHFNDTTQFHFNDTSLIHFQLVCGCSEWGNNNISYANNSGTFTGSVTCNGSVTLMPATLFTFTPPVFQCTYDSSTCQVKYNWKKDGVQQGQTINSNPGFSFSFTAGIHTIRITPICGNDTCAPCEFTVIGGEPDGYYIGKSFGGGKIFYIDATGQHGLIAAPSDIGAPENLYPLPYINLWSDYPTILINATGTAVGTGQANTNAIIAVYGAQINAAKQCDQLVIGAYSDWYLPSKDELNLLYLQKNVIGGFANAYYWSSSEFDLPRAWHQHFGTSIASTITKEHSYQHIRPIRSF